MPGGRQPRGIEARPDVHGQSLVDPDVVLDKTAEAGHSGIIVGRIVLVADYVIVVAAQRHAVEHRVVVARGPEIVLGPGFLVFQSQLQLVRHAQEVVEVPGEGGIDIVARPFVVGDYA